VSYPLVRLIDRARGDENGHLADIAGQRSAEPQILAEIADLLRQRRVMHQRSERPPLHLAALGGDLVEDASGVGGQRADGIG
jgi:hypothetical protein